MDTKIKMPPPLQGFQVMPQMSDSKYSQLQRRWLFHSPYYAARAFHLWGAVDKVGEAYPTLSYAHNAVMAAAIGKVITNWTGVMYVFQPLGENPAVYLRGMDIQEEANALNEAGNPVDNIQHRGALHTWVTLYLLALEQELRYLTTHPGSGQRFGRPRKH